jgi:hypothetical protein
MILVIGDLRAEVVNGWNAMWSRIQPGRLASERRAAQAVSGGMKVEESRRVDIPFSSL